MQYEKIVGGGEKERRCIAVLKNGQTVKFNFFTKCLNWMSNVLQSNKHGKLYLEGGGRGVF